MEKHLAFLLDCPSKGEFMMFPDYYENIKEDIDKKYEQVDFEITKLRWEAELTRTPYKVFKTKKKEK